MNRLFDSIALARPYDSNDYVTLDIHGIRNNTVHIVLDSHFTIVSDNSGTGKTYIHDVIENRGRNRINIECNLPVVTIRKVSEFGDLVEKSLVIIDEDADCIINGIDELQEKVLNTNHVFLIFSRDKAFAGIPYSIDDIKVVKSYRGTITLENKYPSYYERTIPKCIHHYIEDETTGLQFFRKVFPDIVSTHGKDNYKKIGIHNEPTLFIFDRCGFGNVHEEFLLKYGNYDWLHLLDYESFEYLLLDYTNNIPKRTIDIVNKEVYYEKILSSVLSQYGKHDSCKCLDNCNSCKLCKFEFKLVNSRNVLLGTEYGKYMEV